MSPDSLPGTSFYYEIQLSGQLSPEIAEWIGMALTIKHTHPDASITVLSGVVTDQAALFGILNRIRDLGLRLISVNRVEPQLEEHGKRFLPKEEE
jgi:hypothetical protein